MIIKLKLIVLGIFLATLCSETNAQRNWLLQIKPLEMRRDQLDALTSTPAVEVRDEQILYKLKEGNLFVGLSVGRCEKTSWGTWNVEKGTVLNVIFYPAKKWKPSRFGLSSAGMRKEIDHGHETFTNDEEGVYFSVQRGKLSGITLSPSTKHEYLNCVDKKAREH